MFSRPNQRVIQISILPGRSPSVAFLSTSTIVSEYIIGIPATLGGAEKTPQVLVSPPSKGVQQ